MDDCSGITATEACRIDSLARAPRSRPRHSSCISSSCRHRAELRSSQSPSNDSLDMSEVGCLWSTVEMDVSRNPACDLQEMLR